MQTRPYHNNLRQGDLVLEVDSGRRGVVDKTPRETGRRVCVLLTGTTVGRYFDVRKLRFIPPGSQVAEDVPPIDGELPPEAPAPQVQVRRVEKNDPVEMLEARRREIAEERKRLENQFSRLREEDAKLERAVAVLKGST